MDMRLECIGIDIQRSEYVVIVWDWFECVDIEFVPNNQAPMQADQALAKLVHNDYDKRRGSIPMIHNLEKCSMQYGTCN